MSCRAGVCLTASSGPGVKRLAVGLTGHLPSPLLWDDRDRPADLCRSGHLPQYLRTAKVWRQCPEPWPRSWICGQWHRSRKPAPDLWWNESCDRLTSWHENSSNNLRDLRSTQVSENPFADATDDRRRASGASDVDPCLQHEKTGNQIMNLFILVGGLMGAARRCPVCLWCPYGWRQCHHRCAVPVVSCAAFCGAWPCWKLQPGTDCRCSTFWALGSPFLRRSADAPFCRNGTVFDGCSLLSGMAMIGGWIVIAVSGLRTKSR